MPVIWLADENKRNMKMSLFYAWNKKCRNKSASSKHCKVSHPFNNTSPHMTKQDVCGQKGKLYLQLPSERILEVRTARKNRKPELYFYPHCSSYLTSG